MVERNLAKVDVVGSNPIIRSPKKACISRPFLLMVCSFRFIGLFEIKALAIRPTRRGFESRKGKNKKTIHLMMNRFLERADDGIRTHDINLGKVALYH